MPNDTLNEREFELINIVGAELASTQRDLSHHMDLSLGITNMLIRRLIAKGYIRIRQLNKRKVEYILTSKGFSEKIRKSIKYTLKTINSIGLIKEGIKTTVLKLYYEGERSFVVLGKSDFALLIEIAFKELGITDYKITYVDELPAGQNHSAILICKEGVHTSPENASRTIDLIHELAKDNQLVANGLR